MGTQLRPDLPGVAFHLTARAQHQAHVFTPALRTRIVELLGQKLDRSDARLLAYVIMSNHIHLVVIQGAQRLERLMQPWLRSVALATHRVHGTEGHVFERRFRDRVCRTPEHVRNAIAYTHANPVKAGMCARPDAYRWSSHRLYARNILATPCGPRVDIAAGLDSFVSSSLASRSPARTAYLDYLDGVLQTSDERQVDPGEWTNGAGPDKVNGRPPLETLADRVVGEHEGVFTIADLRSRHGPRARLPVRARLIIEASRAGYLAAEIADYLKISQAAVSRTRSGATQHAR
jgi:putative transposase